MIEREKCGPDMKAALAESGIFYCYLDDFYSGNSEDIKKNALFKEMYRWIDNSVHLNVNDTAGYSEITLVDIRYISPSSLGKMIDFTKADDALFLYSASVINNSETIK